MCVVPARVSELTCSQTMYHMSEQRITHHTTADGCLRRDTLASFLHVESDTPPPYAPRIPCDKRSYSTGGNSLHASSTLTAAAKMPEL